MTKRFGHVARLLLIRHHRHVARRGRADDAGKPAGLFGERVDVRVGVPATVAGHRRRGPHQPEPRPERRGDRQRQRAVDVEQHHDPGLVDRREHDLPHRERRVRVDERGRLGTDVNRGHDVAAVDVERVALEPERQREVVDDLERIDPRFERAVLVPEQRRAPADDVEERAGVRSHGRGGTHLSGSGIGRPWCRRRRLPLDRTDNATQRTPGQHSRSAKAHGCASRDARHRLRERRLLLRSRQAAIHESRSRVDFCVVNTFFAHLQRLRY